MTELQDDLIFNILDYYEIDEKNIDNEENVDGKENDNLKKYIIKIFGRTREGKSVYLKVYDYPPHFYILLPNEWNTNLKSNTNRLINILKNEISKIKHYDLDKLINNDIVDRKKFYGFHANDTFKFLRLIFNNKRSMYDVAKILDDKILFDNKLIKLDLYESNIEPLLGFLHTKDIVSCGWIKIPKDKLMDIDKESYCNINKAVLWNNIESLNITDLAPFYICSFDIECTSGDGTFPQANRKEDKIIQIGLVFSNYGSSKIIKKIMISLDTCDNIEDTIVITCKTEIELLLKFQEIIVKEDPDILTGYNIFAFDESYIMNRAAYLKLPNIFYYLSKLKDYKCKLVNKTLSSAALGDNSLNYIDCIGRINLDLMKVIQRDYKLSSYKLDSVAEHFIKEKILNIEYSISDDIYIIYSNNINMLSIGNYIKLDIDNDILPKKYKISNLNYNENYFNINDLSKDIYDNYISKSFKEIFWGLVKDDIKPNQIFEYYNKDSKHRKIIAEYCIQDCVLVSKLVHKLEVITNNISMASVCNVPLSYIFFRGQGIKSLSLVAKYCKKNKFLIPVIKKIDDNNTYEGATVFEPIIGFYKKPIVVLDYNSLYPSSIISKNISHETLVELPQYDNLPDYNYYDVYYQDSNNNTIHCRYSKKKNNKYGILPTILMGLLNERKQTKKLMEKEKDIFKKNILDGKQLALKITANSIYGQLGASVSPIFFKHGAACTTAIGREMLNLARDFVENKFTNILDEIYLSLKYNSISLFDKYINEKNIEYEHFLKTYLLELLDNYTIKPKIIYGDTDSIFIDLNLNNKSQSITIYHNILLYNSINIGKCISYFLKTLLPYPHNMEYEKTFYPFALLAKKKYIGNKYEQNINNYKFISMGVVLIRRDNANIVKKIIGKMVNIMMNEIDVDKTIKYIKQAIKDLLKGKYDITDFITTKTLKGFYKGKKLTTDIFDEKDPHKELRKKGEDGKWRWDDVESSQAHVCLCQRIKNRDIGNAPQLNDRIPYIAIQTPIKKGIKILQGNKIEHPDYIIENNLKIDYLFYLTNQIMNPSIQFLELIMEPKKAKKLFQDIIDKENNKNGAQALKKYIELKSQDNNITQFDDFIDFTQVPIISTKTKKSKKKNI